MEIQKDGGLIHFLENNLKIIGHDLEEAISLAGLEQPMSHGLSLIVFNILQYLFIEIKQIKGQIKTVNLRYRKETVIFEITYKGIGIAWEIAGNKTPSEEYLCLQDNIALIGGKIRFVKRKSGFIHIILTTPLIIRQMKNEIKIALVDDHTLLRSGLKDLLGKLGYSVILECGNGIELMEKLDKSNLPDIILMDINMPKMDGFESALWLKKNHPEVNVIALSMYDDENAIIRMVKNGAKGYILKDSNPTELKLAIEAVIAKGFHYSDLVTGRLIHSINQLDEEENNTRQVLNLNDKEIEFLKFAGTEMTYKEIAQKMNLSPRTIDGYRDNLFDKLKIKSRVGLVLFAVKNGIIHF